MVQNKGDEGGMGVLPPDVVLDGDVCLLLLIFMVYITDPPVAGPGTQGRFPYKVQQLETHTTPLQKVMKLHLNGLFSRTFWNVLYSTMTVRMDNTSDIIVDTLLTGLGKMTMYLQ